VRDSGTYALVIALGARLNLRVGALGVHSFLPGYYIYVGSALGGVSARLRHHVRSGKRFHWHIDYLLAEAELAEIWYALGQDRVECKWNEIVENLPGAAPSVPGFGTSDCGCYTHLTYFPAVPSFSLFAQRLEQSKLPQAYQLDLTK
jgi:Uri superfamily endonuclease